MLIIYKMNEKGINYQALKELYHGNADWLMPKKNEEWRELVENTQLWVTAYDREKIIGFAKLFTDFVRWGQVYDVVVDRNYQGKGIGSGLIKQLIDHESVQRVRTFWLGTSGERIQFYEKLGFKKHPPESNAHSLFLVRKHRDDEMKKFTE